MGFREQVKHDSLLEAVCDMFVSDGYKVEKMVEFSCIESGEIDILATKQIKKQTHYWMIECKYERNSNTVKKARKQFKKAWFNYFEPSDEVSFILAYWKDHNPVLEEFDISRLL